MRLWETCRRRLSARTASGKSHPETQAVQSQREAFVPDVERGYVITRRASDQTSEGEEKLSKQEQVRRRFRKWDPAFGGSPRPFRLRTGVQQREVDRKV